MIRSELREHIFKMLFQIEFHEPEDMPEHLLLYLESLDKATEQDREYIRNKYERIVEKVPEIDRMIDQKTTGWKTKRMNRVDLTILRLAVYEMKWDEEVPVGVAIDQAVELAKRFSAQEGPSFVNGVLAKLIEEKK